MNFITVTIFVHFRTRDFPEMFLYHKAVVTFRFNFAGMVVDLPATKCKRQQRSKGISRVTMVLALRFVCVEVFLR